MLHWGITKFHLIVFKQTYDYKIPFWWKVFGIHAWMTAQIFYSVSFICKLLEPRANWQPYAQYKHLLLCMGFLYDM